MKTTKPIRVLCIGFEPTPALLQLVADGHTVEHGAVAITVNDLHRNLDHYDLILCPKAWRYLPDVSDKFIDRVVKEARAGQPAKPKKVKAKKVSDGTTPS
jgi:hypothetical protein